MKFSPGGIKMDDVPQWPIILLINLLIFVCLFAVISLCVSSREWCLSFFKDDSQDEEKHLLEEEDSTDLSADEKYVVIIPDQHLPMTALKPVRVQPDIPSLFEVPPTPLPGKGPFVWTTASEKTPPTFAEQTILETNEEIAMDHGANQGLGQLCFSVSYDRQLKHLCVRIISAKDLPAMDVCGTSDPFVKVSILPDRKNKLTTTVQYRTLQPIWNEVFVFENFPERHLQTRTVLMKIIDEDKLSKNDLIGCVTFPLVHLYNEENTTIVIETWKFIRFEKKTKGFVGEIFLALCYSPQECCLEVTVVRAKDLLPMDYNGEADPFCVLKLFGPDQRLISKKVSKVCKKTRCPEWDQKFYFRVSPNDVPRCSVEIFLYDKDFFNQRKMGRIRLNSRSSTEQSKHWNTMLSKPREQYSQWHILKQ